MNPKIRQNATINGWINGWIMETPDPRPQTATIIAINNWKKN
jgi:hypothetical protein